ncbi:TetR/AcrR family transcriptional regulator [Aquidulcibacter paucihalophilus]|uniref:TetR/AcrR family transcriptional regulator n=1 Tax=Aquidulcibacter paucihalophilus TaxID=1978549 RepID=UPI0012FF8DC0|nr:helix-turn-helix domain-containing protein [Aquidulcibacter paucihalophilus]
MKNRKSGRAELLKAAQLEFEDHGFDGTQTNAIARRAGYAPQTFYRHFPDKKAIFLAIYLDWTQAEAQGLAKADTITAMIDTLLSHHVAHRLFRRSLRQLTSTDPEVAAVRAQSRQQQMSALTSRFPHLSNLEALTLIFTLERLCDAWAEGEFEACGISKEQARSSMSAILTSALRAAPKMG